MRSEYEANQALATKPVKQDNRELLNERHPLRSDEKPAVKAADPSNPSTWAVI